MSDGRPLRLAAVLGLSLPILGSTVVSSVGQATLEQVCAAGVDEGSFVYWAQFADENWQKVADGFAEAYPGIDIQFLALNDQEIPQRIITAVSAGRAPGVDLVSLDLPSQALLVERDLIDTDVDWTEIGVPEHLISSVNAVRTSVVGIGLAYNTDNTDPDDLPDTWEELIDERYATQAVVDPRGRPFGSFALEWSEEQTLDYVRRFKDVVQPIVIEGGTAGMTAVLNGEAMFATGGRGDSALELQSNGAPIEIKYLDLIPTDSDFNTLVVGAASPNAAKCFAGWQATPEGAAIFESVEFKENLDRPRGAPEDGKIIVVETAEEADLNAKMLEGIAAIWR